MSPLSFSLLSWVPLKGITKMYYPLQKKLAKKVMGTCASKLKPYTVELIQSTCASLSYYAKVVSSICQKSFSVLDHVETRLVKLWQMIASYLKGLFHLVSPSSSLKHHLIQCCYS